MSTDTDPECQRVAETYLRIRAENGPKLAEKWRLDDKRAKLRALDAIPEDIYQDVGIEGTVEVSAVYHGDTIGTRVHLSAPHYQGRGNRRHRRAE